MKVKQLKPLDSIVTLRAVIEDKTESGIILGPPKEKEEVAVFEVIRAGENCTRVKPGDKVALDINRITGFFNHFTDEQQDVIIASEFAIIGIYEI